MDFWGPVKIENITLVEEFYNKIMDKENIMDSWLLVRTPIPVFIILVYLAVIKIGLKLMENRQPYEIILPMRIYNVFQIFFNIYLVFAFIVNPTAIPVLIRKSCSADIGGEGMASLRYAFLYYTWGFMISKIIDLLDTVFMVLRKKNSHITFLHVYHHTAMVFFTWVTLKYAKAHQGALPGLINLTVHVFMYTYYFLATFGPKMEKYLWWKKHLTKLQLAQFVVIVIYLFTLYYYQCPISRVFTYIWLFNASIFLCLFVNFYVRAYILKPAAGQKQQPKKQKTS